MVMMDETAVSKVVQMTLDNIAAQGLVIVPREPTAAMCFAGANETENGDGQLHRRKWLAMIAATTEVQS
jgi:hypothetical protein